MGSSSPPETEKARPGAEPARTPTSSLAGTKRPAASTLLPPLELLSSSPSLPRPSKRHNAGHAHARLKYPSPMPSSSSTGVVSSSSPASSAALLRPSSERTPLLAVPTVELPENGDTITMGRSSSSSHVHLSANKLISRVHVKARYIPAPSLLAVNRIEIVCDGWNGLTVHSQGRTWNLAKADSFTSEMEGTGLIVDVLDSRVMIQWPKRSDNPASPSDSSLDDSPPRARLRASSLLQSSPMRRGKDARITSPVSPTPARNPVSASSSQRVLLPDIAGRNDDIRIYEDESDLPHPRPCSPLEVNTSIVTESNPASSFSNELRGRDDEHDLDEENDPAVHSFSANDAWRSGC